MVNREKKMAFDQRKVLSPIIYFIVSDIPFLPLLLLEDFGT